MSDPLDWKLVKSEYVFTEPWLKARKDTCITASGKQVDNYYVIEYPDWVNAFALTAEGKVLMVKQFRQGLGKTIIEVPGGCVDPTDATLEDAIRRELLEETGYTFSHVEPMGSISANAGTTTNLTHYFFATGGVKVSQQSLDEHEELDVLLMSIDEVKALLQQHEIWQSLHAACLFYGLIKAGEMQW
ncbi:8-oxo-dGTP pyrophosphatase MutT (NUDIX family) [Chitinophaga skermanii]|uniref:GDP-mannose pyrophosphatase n=1 Tax=Chitinophaga skermanii TaxID=331697 RepID=A0A327QQR0_9BACT|nr:NUDIX hydrolase [Chitinophaga skermanii]RAJ06899.1 8-oxo-dGTP pyrophosphatase MutT (NUDIX family) [Chitinophaga skermanii]